ncbi:PIR Superfamily Protein [Plasmodium ovale curtisi]|uniref:PIR Superfamily Protein n=1 Tax=Plasmodium ovale curtisi TaxID=864141 RepID=A0A1A8WLP1_PLAOA|nr:PIR Superfamily Protein [Plasmodium ovale curtisi]SBT00301.1 PIR Superfamily Protein [Plasmodium ovale curtisi]
MASGDLNGGLIGKSSKELYSEKFYEALEHDYSDSYKYHEKCNKIVVSSKKNEMIRMCEKILDNLDNSTVLNTANSSYDVCILFNYWIYDTLAGIYGAENTMDIAHAFSSLQLILGYLNYNPKNKTFYEKCKLSYNIDDHEDWKHRKQLYDYYVDYDYLYKMASSFDPECEYYKKIEEKTSLFKHFDNLCSSNPTKCPKFYNQCQYKIKADRASTERASSANHSPGHGKVARIDGDGPALQGIADGLHIRDSTFETSQIGTKVGHSVLGIAPVLVTATALYRYTPIGLWIRKISGINKNSLSNMDESEIDGFSSNAHESGDMFFDNTPNYISYQPI